MIEKELTFLRSKFHLTCQNWMIEGDVMEWNYEVKDDEAIIMQAHKEAWHLSDTYVIDVVKPEDVLLSVMIVLAIDAVKCSNANG